MAKSNRRGKSGYLMRWAQLVGVWLRDQGRITPHTIKPPRSFWVIFKGNNWADKRIVNTFEKVLSIHLSEAEANGFLQYLLLRIRTTLLGETDLLLGATEASNQEQKHCVNVYENENRFLVELEKLPC